MAFKITGKVEGLAALIAALDGVEKKIRRKAIKKAVSEAGKIVLKSAKSKARRATGLLKRSLGRKVKVYRGSGVAVAIVGPRKGFREAVVRGGGKETLSDPIRYAHLVELGTRRSQAFPFLRPAFEDNKAILQQAMETIIREALP